MTRAFMTDPVQLKSLEGQQYVVLRPTGAVAEFYDREQAALLADLPDAVTHPATGHVTLRGFHEPTRVTELKAAVAAWAQEQNAIDVSVDAVDGFPTPFQIVIARLARSVALVNAYATLTTALDATDFHRIGELPLDEWIFHMSLAYCGELRDTDWQDVHVKSARLLDQPVRETVSEVEFVWYSGGIEHREVIPLARADA